jgi:hypothetical protein
MGNVACWLGTEGLRSRFEGIAMCGLCVKRAAHSLSPKVVLLVMSRELDEYAPFSRRRTQRLPSLSFRRQTFLDWTELGSGDNCVGSTR